MWKGIPEDYKLGTSPGEVLRDLMMLRQLSPDGLAQQMDWSRAALQDVIDGREAVTPELAMKLQDTLGVPAIQWLKLEAAYRAGMKDS